MRQQSDHRSDNSRRLPMGIQCSKIINEHYFLRIRTRLNPVNLEIQHFKTTRKKWNTTRKKIKFSLFNKCLMSDN